MDTVVITRVYEEKLAGNLPYFIGRNTLQVEGVPLGDYGYNRRKIATSPIISICPEKALPNNLIFFGMNVSDNFRLASNFEKLDSLIKLPKITLDVQNTSYKDVIVLYTADRYRREDVYKLYWSISKGYIRLINKNQDSCELVKKYNNTELFEKYRATPEY